MTTESDPSSSASQVWPREDLIAQAVGRGWASRQRLETLAGEPAMRAMVALLALGRIAEASGDATVQGLVAEVKGFALEAAGQALTAAGYQGLELAAIQSVATQDPSGETEA